MMKWLVTPTRGALLGTLLLAIVIVVIGAVGLSRASGSDGGRFHGLYAFPIKASLEDFWFADGDSLVVVEQEDGFGIRITIDRLDRNPVGRTIRMIRPLDFHNAPKGAVLIYGSRFRRQDYVNEGAVILYCVSWDGQRVAWIERGTINVVGVVGRQVKLLARAKLRSQFVSGLAFTANGSIFVVFDDGKLELWASSPLRRNPAGSWLDGPWIPRAVGSDLLITSLESGDWAVASITKEGRLSMRFMSVPDLNISAVGLSPGDRMVAGTRDGNLLEIKKSGVRPLGSIVKGGTISSLAFVRREAVLVAGNFPGLYLFAEGRDPLELNAHQPINQLAAAGNRVAYLEGEGALFLGEFRGPLIYRFWIMLLVIGTILSSFSVGKLLLGSSDN